MIRPDPGLIIVLCLAMGLAAMGAYHMGKADAKTARAHMSLTTPF